MPSKPGSRQRLYRPVAQTGTKMEHRERSRKEYHTNRWTVISRKFRASHPLCQRCLETGIVTESEVVDHIIPVEVHGKFWDRYNYQALCKKCNIIKGNEDKKLINEHRKAIK